MIAWFSAMTVTVAPLTPSRLTVPESSCPWPISSLASAALPMYWPMNLTSVDSGIPASRIGSECLRIRTPVMMPRVSMPISVTIGLPE